MTAVDDSEFLLRHLRTCFVTSDDSGLCELLVEPDLLRDAKRQRSNSKVASGSSYGSDQETLDASPDILPDMDFGGTRRPRSTTEIRIEQIKKDKAEKTKVKTIKCKHAEATVPLLDDEAAEELFAKKDLSQKTSTRTSRLAALLKEEQKSVRALNPFDEFKQFDGESHMDLSVKKIEIYIKLGETSSNSSDTPLLITVVTSATVEQTIGLICWKYTILKREPALSPDLTLYSLHMTEDDGEVDHDFPALAHKEPISKFGFSKLALVVNKPTPPPLPDRSISTGPKATDIPVRRRKTTPLSDTSNQPVTVHIPEQGSTKLLVNLSLVTVDELLQLVLERRHMSPTNEKYELTDAFNRPLDPNLVLSNCLSREFYVTNSSNRPMQSRAVMRVTSLIENPGQGGLAFPDIDSLDSSSRDPYSVIGAKTYLVNVVTKVFSNSSTQLVVKSNCLEISPLGSKPTIKNPFQNKHTVIDAKSLLSCAVSKIKSSGKSVFSIHYSCGETSNAIRQLTFEATESIASEIVDNINELIKATSDRTEKQRRISSMY